MKSTMQSASRALGGLLQRFVRTCLRRPHAPLSFEEAQAPGVWPVPVFWAGRWGPEDTRHHAIAGTTCSGKSLLLSLYLRSVIPQLIPGSDRRLVLFDPKNELHSGLFAGAQVPVHFLLPSDMRSSRWELARDFTNSAAVMRLCRALVPPVPGDSNPSFTAALEELLGGVINSLNRTQPGRWDLADVVHILERREFMTQVLARTSETRCKLRFLNEERTWAGIAPRLETCLKALRIIAGMWSRTGDRTFSLVDFVNSEGILIMGRDLRYATLFDPLNTLLLTQLFSRLLEQEYSTTRRTYLVIDELNVVGGGEDKPLPGFRDICERGAARGVVIVVAYQSYAHIKELYKEGGDAILGMLQNQVFLRAGDYPTAKFASEAFGKRREWIKCVDSSRSGSHAVSNQWHELEIVPYEKFFELQCASWEDGITGYWLSPPLRHESQLFHLPGDWIAANLPKGSADPESYLRPDAHQDLDPLSPSDLQRLELRLPGAGLRTALVPLEQFGWAVLPGDDITRKSRGVIGSARSVDDHEKHDQPRPDEANGHDTPTP